MIYEMLSEGENNAKTAKDLATCLGLEIREVMQAVRSERLRDKAICSTCKGFFKPARTEDLKATVFRLQKQAYETNKVADSMQKVLEGQGTE